MTGRVRLRVTSVSFEVADRDEEMSDAARAAVQRALLGDREGFGEDAHSRSTSSSSRSDESSFFPIFRSAKKQAVASSLGFPVAASAPASASSSSASAVEGAIVWVDRSNDPKYSSEIWKTGVFLCSEKKDKETGKYKVKCKFCAWIRDYDGTTDLAYHAEKSHPTLPTVAAYMKAKLESANVRNEQKLTERQNLIQVFYFCIFGYR